MRAALTLPLAVTLLALTTSAEDRATRKGPPDHQWLKRFNGEWTSVTTSMGQQMQGSMTSRMVGQYWVVNTYKATVNNVPFEGLQTIGYDSGKGAFVGTWVDSMMNHLWHYEGHVDDTGQKIVLNTEGPDFTTGKMTRYRDSYAFKTADLFVATSEMQGDDGTWTTIMTAEVKRKAR